jgi:hypothetical protein
MVAQLAKIFLALHEILQFISPLPYSRKPTTIQGIVKKAKAVPLHTTEALAGERRYSSYSFLTSALDGGEWSASRPCRALPRGKDTPPTRTHCKEGWVDPRAGLDTEAIGKILSPLPGIEPRSLGSPAHSQTLY